MIQPSRSFKHLKHTVPITTVFEDQGVISRFRKQGQRLIGPCPIHGGNNPNAFVISIPKNTWYCFTQCHAGGDLIDLVQKLLGYSYTQTADYLASLNPGHFHPSETKILPSVRFRPYTRQLTLDPFSPFLHKKGITPQTALRFETGAYHGPGFLHQTIGVRLCDLTGQPLGYAARRLNQTDIATYGKWRFPHNFPKSRILYNYHRIAASKTRILVITECPWASCALINSAFRPWPSSVPTCLKSNSLSCAKSPVCYSCSMGMPQAAVPYMIFKMFLLLTPKSMH